MDTPPSLPPRLPRTEDSGSLKASRPTFWMQAKRLVLGGPKNLADKTLFHRLSLIAFLAWIGLGADAISSSCYGPPASFAVIRDHPHLAVLLALATAVTVFVISAAYSRMVEVFPNGGGYGVATRLLGPHLGVVSGCALMVDYVLTIATSIVATGDALFSFIPSTWFTSPHQLGLGKLWVEMMLILGLIVLNLRGVKESILILTPIFLLFLVTHVLLLGGGVLFQLPEIGNTATTMVHGYHQDWTSAFGLAGMLALFLSAYSMGGGTYTGIEAVSNALPLMREPRVQTAQRTMIYLSVSLAITAGGLLLCYLLWNIPPANGEKTMNAILAERVGAHLPMSQVFVIATLVAEGALLIVAAQAGFVGGPRVLANMAVDSWMPRRFAALSERLTTANGIAIMGAASLAALLFAYFDAQGPGQGGPTSSHNTIDVLLVMYSINVFLTFSLTMAGMVRWWWRRPVAPGPRRKRLALFGSGFVLCATILIVTVYEKYGDGGWITIVVTGTLVALCLLIRTHYQQVSAKLNKLFAELNKVPRNATAPSGDPAPSLPTAVVLVGGYGGLGIHTVLNVFRSFPNHFKGLVFVSVGVVDSGGFKGEDTLDALRHRTEESLKHFVDLAHGLGLPACYRFAIGTDAVDEAAKLCLQVAKDFPHATFFAGKVIFQRERWYQWLLHNDTAFAVQKRLHWAGRTMVVLPARIR